MFLDLRWSLVRGRRSLHQPNAEMMQNGVEFDPVQGVQDENGQIYVYDGLHRGSAAKQIGASLWADIQLGIRLEAEWLALTANQKHGLRRSREDLRRIVRLALLHPNGVNLSNNELARHCGVSDKTVGKIRSELEASSEIPKIERRGVTRAGQTSAQNTRHIGGQGSRPIGVNRRFWQAFVTWHLIFPPS